MNSTGQLDDERFVNSDSLVVVVESPSDSDVDIYYPPRKLHVNIAPEPQVSPLDTTFRDPLDTTLKETIDSIVTDTLAQSPSQQADTLQAILTDYTYSPADSWWPRDFATCCQAAQDWRHDNPNLNPKK